MRDTCAQMSQAAASACGHNGKQSASAADADNSIETVGNVDDVIERAELERTPNESAREVLHELSQLAGE